VLIQGPDFLFVYRIKSVTGRHAIIVEIIMARILPYLARPRESFLHAGLFGLAIIAIVSTFFLGFNRRQPTPIPLKPHWLVEV